MKRFYLVDCNNFFVSCERVFNPVLVNKPVVVLSSNDACIIARSQEAKKIGIKMGQPLFECKHLIERHKVHVLSSNFPLYADMSDRVMKTITHFSSDIEIYSIDEAFFHYETRANEQQPGQFYTYYGHMLRSQIKQHVGIPTSIGIGPTKTLAKVANKIAKETPEHTGVFDITNHPDQEQLLRAFSVEDIWGIGYRYSSLLKKHGIKTAYDLIGADDRWIRKHMTIQGLKTVYELRGTPALTLDDPVAQRQSLCVSRQFGKTFYDKQLLQQAGSSYATTAAAKLRKQKSVTGTITVFVCWLEYQSSQRYYESYTVHIAQSTNYTPTIVRAVFRAIDTLYKPGRLYKKIGVILTNLSSDQHLQLTLDESKTDIVKQQKIMGIIDTINQRMGASQVYFASNGIDRSWKTKADKKSSSFTTQWAEILTIQI